MLFVSFLRKNMPPKMKSVIKKMWGIPTNNVKKKSAKPKTVSKQKKETKPKKVVVQVMEKTGWSREEAEKKITDAIKRTGCARYEYRLYHFFEKNEQEQSQQLLDWMRRLVRKKYDTKEFTELSCDKARSNAYFNEYLKRIWCLNTDITREEFVQKFAGCSKIIYKPINGEGGKGIETFSFDEYPVDKIYDMISHYPEGVVEEYVVQHPEMSRLCPTSVNTIRIVTVCSKKNPVTPDGRYFDIAYGIIRIGTGEKCVDNLSSGGMAVGIDLTTGKLNTAASNWAGETYESHPMTGVTFKGFQLPYFQEALQLIEEMSQKELIEGLVGWDIAITETGPILIGFNRTPGNAAVIPYAVAGIPTRPFFEKYLTSEEFAAGLQAASKANLEKFINLTKKNSTDKQQKLLEKEERAITKVMEATGWSREETEAKINKAKERTKCSANEYYFCRFFEKTEHEQKEICTHWVVSCVGKKYNTREFGVLTNNKARCNAYFEKFLRRPWCLNTEIDKDTFIQRFANCRKIIYKPLWGHCGYGIEAFDVDEKKLGRVYHTLALYPQGVVEEYVKQHPVLSRFCPDSVNTLRIVSVCSKRQPVTADGKYFDIAYAAIRVGGGKSIVDNIHSGGLSAVIDLNSGRIMTDAVDLDGNIYKTHPLTGAAFRGIEIPYFREALELVREASQLDMVEGCIGWDIAITETGPVLIEVNMNPGTMLLSVPCAAAQIPTKHIMEKYL